MAGKSTWTDEQNERLRALWAEGHSTAQIAASMGMTKNATVGRAHRMGLPSRPSPIIKDGRPRAPRPLARSTRQHAARLPALISVPVAATNRVEGRERQEAQFARKSVAAQPLKVEEPPAVVFKPRNTTACCWPTGEGKAIRFECVAVAVLGKPYCRAHHAIAYTTRPEAHVDLAPRLPNRQGVTGTSGVGFV